MIQIRPSQQPYLPKDPDPFDVHWAHSESKRLHTFPEYRFEEEKSESIHIYESNLIQHEQSIGTWQPQK